jgi:hypothetical protein
MEKLEAENADEKKLTKRLREGRSFLKVLGSRVEVLENIMNEQKRRVEAAAAKKKGKMQAK